MSRVVSWFSCGAASAYATYLAHKEWSENPEGSTFHAVYCKVKEESEDNMRFLKDFEESTGIPIEVIGDDSLNCSIYDVFLNRKFIKGPQGAPCTMVLKKWQRKAYQEPTDRQVFGYTIEESNRIDRFIDSNNDVDSWFILEEKGITKPECLEFIRDRGIEIPLMYRLGYANNNCVGCVKGGMGYWNAIRTDFPGAFHKMEKLERTIGHAINKGPEGPVYLDELAPDRGNFTRDMPGDCGFTCEVKEQTDFITLLEVEND